jgi:hypothetical protein
MHSHDTISLLCLTIALIVAARGATSEVIPDDSQTRVSKPWSLESYPNPLENPEACEASSEVYICDPDMVLELEEGT